MAILDKDQWLSSILGKSVFQIDSGFVSQLANSHLPQGAALVMVKVPVSNVLDCIHLQRLNFSLVDTNVQLQKLSDKSSSLTNNLTIRFSNSDSHLFETRECAEIFHIYLRVKLSKFLQS
jgi:hypothetical protein